MKFRIIDAEGRTLHEGAMDYRPENILHREEGSTRTYARHAGCYTGQWDKTHVCIYQQPPGAR